MQLFQVARIGDHACSRALQHELLVCLFSKGACYIFINQLLGLTMHAYLVRYAYISII